MYWSPQSLLSYNRFLNIVVGSRGVGKTFSFKRICIDAFIKNKEQFVWVRRTDVELKELPTKFITDVATLFPEHEFYITKDLIHIRPKTEKQPNENKWEIAGYLIALSTSQKHKSSSFHGVTRVIYDEFITKGLYLKDELTLFLDLLETVFRTRTKTKVYMLANSLSIDNPYFNEWKITKLDRRFTKNKILVVENCDASSEFKEFKSKTELGKLIHLSSQYESFAVDNQFLLDNSQNVVPMFKGENQYVFNLVLNNKEIGMYIINALVYFGNPVLNGRRFTIYADDAVNNNAILVDKKNQNMQYIAKKYQRNECYFMSIPIKNEIILMCRYLIKNY